MPTAGVTDDIIIRTIGGTTYGFMLVRGTDGRRGFQLRDARAIPPRTVTEGEITEAESYPEYAAYWSQDDWQAGLGGINYADDPKRMALGTKIDTTVRGKIRPARETRSTTVDTAPNAYKVAGFAIVGTEVWAFIGRDMYAWNYIDNDWDIGTAPLAAGVVYRNGIEYDGKTYVPCWYTSDDSPCNYIYKADADANWARVSDNPGASSVTQCKYFAKGKSASGGDILWGGNWATLADSAANLNEALDTSETDVDVTDGTKFAAADVILIDNELMTVSSIVVNTLTVTRASLGTTAATHSIGTDISKRTWDGKHHIRSTTGPTSQANWTSAVEIGESDSEITALISDGNTVLICKTNGIYAYYADGTVENLTPEFSGMAHPDNFRAAFNWNGHLLLPIGSGGLWEMFERQLVDISLSLYAPTQTTLHGRVVAIGGNPPNLYILIQQPASLTYHLLMAQWREFQGKADYRWHHIGTIAATTNTIEEHCTLFAEGIPSGSAIHNRVWLGVESTGSNLLPYFMPWDTDAQDGFTDDADAAAITVKFDGKLPNVEKTFAALDFKSNNLGAGGRKWTISYRLDGGAWTTDLADSAGNADGVIDSPSGAETLTFPPATDGKVLELRFMPAMTGTGTTGPEITYFRLTYQLRPDPRKVIRFAVYLADNQERLNGTRRGRPKLDLAQLEAWNAQADEVTVVDARGTSRDMVFAPGSLGVEEISHNIWSRPEYACTFDLIEV